MQYMQLLMHVNAASLAARSQPAGRPGWSPPAGQVAEAAASNAGRLDYNVTRASEKATVNIFGYWASNCIVIWTIFIVTCFFGNLPCKLQIVALSGSKIVKKYSRQYFCPVIVKNCKNGWLLYSMFGFYLLYIGNSCSYFSSSKSTTLCNMHML